MPDIQPGALNRLEELHIELPELHSTLPASWGSNPDTLSALESLEVRLAVTSVLPPEWAHGFKRLVEARVFGISEADSGAMSEAVVQGLPWQRAAAGGPRTPQRGPPHRLRLPPQWAAGFPALKILALSGLGLAGTIPQAWLQGAFRQLTHL